MNGPVFIAASISRGSGWDSSISLVGHQNIVSVSAFNPRLLCKNPKESLFEPGNVVSVLAIAARSSISLWHTSFPHPLVVFHDVVERDIMDLNWSHDGQTLWACSSDGHVVALQFSLDEITQGVHVCEDSAIDIYHKHVWGDFKRAHRPLAPQSNGATAAQPQQPAAVPVPQKTTILPNGKKRIQPSFVSGLAQPTAVQSFNQPNAPASAAVFPVSGPTPQQPPPPPPPAPQGPMTSTPNLNRQMPLGPPPATHQIPSAFASANAAPPAGPPPIQHNAFRGGFAPPQEYLESMFASSAMAREAAPPNLDTDFGMKPTKYNRNVRGATIGGNREREKREPLIDEIEPAFIPEDGEGSSKEMRLAVPAVKTFLKASPRDWSEPEGEEQTNVERVEVRNFKPTSKDDTTHKPSEVSLWQPPTSGDKVAERTMWLDYQEFYVVAATWNGVFGAVSTLDGMLTVYSAAGRRCGAARWFYTFISDMKILQSHALDDARRSLQLP